MKFRLAYALYLLFIIQVKSFGWKTPYAYSFRKSHRLYGQSGPSISPSVKNLLIGSLIPVILLMDSVNIHLLHSENYVAVADSTGKLSTKLTAKRRYIPRIKQGVVDFLAAKESDEQTRSFIAEKFPDMKRAMSLYGASLRKGEYPDEISRKAEELVTTFESKIDKLKVGPSSKSSDIAAAIESLSNYLEYVKLPSIESGEYSQDKLK